MGGPRSLPGAVPSSCTLLISLAQNPQIDAQLRRVGLSAGALLQARDALGTSLPPEPADWAHRISSRGAKGAKGSDLDQLLAILRSAESRGYRLLERCGADLSMLRRQVIEALSQQNLEKQEQQGSTSLRQSQRRPPSTGPATRQSQRATQSEIESGALPLAQTSLRASQSRAGQAALPSWRETQSAGQPQAIPPTSSSFATSDAQSTPEPDMQPDPQFHRVGQPKPNPRAKAIDLLPIQAQKLGPLYGREDVLQGLADAVSRERPRPPLVVGAHGSGRTCLVQHLARVLSAPVYWLGAHHFSDDAALLAAFEAIAQQKGIAVLDDLDRVATEQTPDILPALAHTWAQRSLRLVTVCSHETRARLEQWIPGILAGLDTMLLPPLPDDAILPSVLSAAPQVLQEHGLAMQAQSVVEQATRLAQRYLSSLAEPGKSIDLLDLAAARTVRKGQSEIDALALRSVVAQRTGLSLDQVQGGADQELLQLETRLAAQVVGHERAIGRICGLIRRNRAGFRSARPIGSVLLLGPSGIGKTEIAKALSLALFSQEDALLRLDMSEFSEAHAVARIIGAPPGYVGHDHGGALADPMIEKPHRVVLLDEIEKAHRDVHQLLLQVLDEGRLTDGRGRTLDFRHALVIMTSNLGADLIAQSPRTRRPSPEPSPELRQEVQSIFPIELWNRIEAPLVLHPLDDIELSAVLDHLVARSSEQLSQERNVSFELGASAKRWILEMAGQDPGLGARPLRHLLRRHIESSLADALLSERIGRGMHVLVEWKRKTLHLRPQQLM